MNEDVSDLFNPEFWDAFFAGIPVGSDREFEMLAKIAAERGVTYAFARQRLNDCLRIRVGELYSLIHPGSPNTIN